MKPVMSGVIWYERWAYSCFLLFEELVTGMSAGVKPVDEEVVVATAVE